jgi:hypothetical protein
MIPAAWNGFVTWLGIGLPPEFANETANSLYVRRFDHTADGGKIHSEDFNQIYRQFLHDKYKH